MTDNPTPVALEGGLQWRKKPVVIEAMRWTREYGGGVAVLRWIGVGPEHESLCATFAYDDPEHAGQLAIFTLEGTMYASEGDWIIRGVQGEFYPCKPDIFEQTYERVLDGEPRPDEIKEKIEAEIEDAMRNRGSAVTDLNESLWDHYIEGLQFAWKLLDGEPREPVCPTNHEELARMAAGPVPLETWVTYNFCPLCGASLKGMGER